MKIYSLRSYFELLDEAGLLTDYKITDGTAAVEFVTYDSKRARPGTLFVCKGAAFREEYLTEAIGKSAVCYLSEKKYDAAVSDFLLVSDVRAAMALLADFFYDKAYEKLRLTGITGTKGKSTTAYYIKYILDEYLQSIHEKPSGIISSIDVYDGIVFKESHLTTPEALELHEHFDNAVRSGLQYMTMEVSSQALKYDRVDGVRFDAGVFLNISEDHISPVEHSDFEDYFSSKLKLFSQCSFAAINLGTDHRDRVLKAARACPEIVTFGIYEDADICGYDVRKEGDEIRFRVRTAEFDEEFLLTMPGLFNVENALAAIAVCRHYGIPLEAMQAGLAKARSKGRMEIFSNSDSSVIAIVDYAHNKLSFEKLYQSITEEYPGRSIITVFGCPGGKAYNRRVELALLAGKYSSKVYLTMEDPGKEPVDKISREIRSNIGNPACECFLIEDRGEAIMQAIFDAEPGSILLVTGKGDETRQKIGSEYVPCQPDTYFVEKALASADRTLLRQIP